MGANDGYANISELGSRSSLADTDILHIRGVDGLDKKMTMTNFFGGITVDVKTTGRMQIANATDDGTSLLQVGGDTDAAAVIGRGKMGTITGTSDWFYISHFDQHSVDNYSMRITASGMLSLNCPAGQTIGLRNSTALVMKIGGDAVNVYEPLLASSGIQTDNEVLKTKVIEIGSWNVDSTQFVEVSHGLTVTNIVRIDALIFADPGTGATPLLAGGRVSVSSSNVLLLRDTGGIFDSSDYNDTTVNRGFIEISYKA